MAFPESSSTVSVGARDDQRVRRILDRILDHLGMDVAYLTQLGTGRQVFRAADGAEESFGVGVEPSCALPPDICTLVVEGEIPKAMLDVAVDPNAAAHPDIFDGTVGAFVGVPVHSPDGAVAGSLCCVSRRPRPDLDEMCVSFVDVLVGFLPEPLAGWEAMHAARTAVKDLLVDGAIVAAMQPIVSVADGRCRGLEALARFPGAGVSPDVAFAQATRVGLDTELERAAIDAVLAQRDLVPQDIYLSFNVGPAGILSEGFAAAVRRHGPLDGLVLEITEHASVAEYEALATVLRPLRADGLRLAVDDVGAGYASLRHVLQMAPDLLKIDRSLVDGISQDLAQRSIVTSIVLLALDLGIETIAEGVETAADAAAVTDLGVDMVQGFLFAAPTTDAAEWSQWETPWLLAGRRPEVARSSTMRLTS